MTAFRIQGAWATEESKDFAMNDPVTTTLNSVWKLRVQSVAGTDLGYIRLFAD